MLVMPKHMHSCSRVQIYMIISTGKKHGQQEGEARVYMCTSSVSVQCQAEAGVCKVVTVQLHAQVTLPKSLCAVSRRPYFAYLQKLLKLQVQMPQREGRTLNPKTACVRVCSRRPVLWLLHAACTWARGLLYRHVLLRHLGHFLSKKVGNEHLIWQYQGSSGGRPRGRKKL